MGIQSNFGREGTYAKRCTVCICVCVQARAFLTAVCHLHGFVWFVWGENKHFGGESSHLLVAFGIIRFAREDRESSAIQALHVSKGHFLHTKKKRQKSVAMDGFYRQESWRITISWIIIKGMFGQKTHLVETSSAPRMAVPLLAAAAVDFPLRLWWPWWRLQRPSSMPHFSFGGGGSRSGWFQSYESK